MLVSIAHLDEKSKKRVLKFIADLSDDGKENRTKSEFKLVDSIINVESIDEAIVLKKYAAGNIKFKLPDGRLF